MKKKIFTLMLAVAMLTGCETAPAAPQTDPEAGSGQPTVQEMLPTPVLHYQVELKSDEREAFDEDGTLLATYRAQVPVMAVLQENGEVLTEAKTPEGEMALAAADVFNRQFASWLDDDHLNTLKEDAKAAREELEANGFQMIGNYAEELTTSVYQTPNFVSVSGLIYSFTGGAHPNTAQMGWNFDLKHGTFFTGEDLSADNSALRDAVTEELIAQAKAVAEENEMKPEELFWPEYETLLADWGSYTVYFNEAGMTVAFAPYELAPYAVGSQEFCLPYEWLQPRLSERGCEVLNLQSPET